MIISAIVAQSENKVIGQNNQLPWRLPADLRHFKTITTGSPILMGRKTHESIGRPLPNRTNIILTRDPAFHAPGCMTVTSIDTAIEIARLSCSKELFIIGGAEVYQQTLPIVQRIYLTLVHHHIQGDAYFPLLDKKEWIEKECVTYPADAENAYSYSFLVLERRI